ncbi:SURF1 family protein [Vibrio ostreicida]|uniref:SURF1 family protein n=1 Tax=Vibrio ostreicida TaxID=526588 RepID=UPI003B5B5AD1
MSTIKASLFGLVKSYSFWVVVLVTLTAFSILVKLGLWQLSRAELKQQMETILDSRKNMAEIELSVFEVSNNDYLTGTRVSADLIPLEGKYVLLDNQTYQGKVGYLAYQLMLFAPERAILVELGFVAAMRQRALLPQVEWLARPLSLSGRLYQRSENPLSHALHIESQIPHRIQNLNIKQLEQYWQHPIAPYVLQPQSLDWPYQQPWVPVPLSSEKHFGYAVQWFAMATALLLLSLWMLVRAIKRGKSNG